jgi:Ankyrin repeats (3 copies)
LKKKMKSSEKRANRLLRSGTTLCSNIVSETSRRGIHKQDLLTTSSTTSSLTKWRASTGESALRDACRDNNGTQLLQLLKLRSLDLNSSDSFGRTALHWAVNNGNLDSARLLLAAGANPNVKDCNGNSPLHLACISMQCGGMKMVRLLLSISNIDVSAADRAGQTPMQWIKSRLRLIKLFVSGARNRRQLVAGSSSESSDDERHVGTPALQDDNESDSAAFVIDDDNDDDNDPGERRLVLVGANTRRDERLDVVRRELCEILHVIAAALRQRRIRCRPRSHSDESLATMANRRALMSPSSSSSSSSSSRIEWVCSVCATSNDELARECSHCKTPQVLEDDGNDSIVDADIEELTSRIASLSTVDDLSRIEELFDRLTI